MRLDLATRMTLIAIGCAVMTVGAAIAAPPRTAPITIGGMTYSSASIKVNRGDVIEWINKDVVDHTATEKQNAVWNVSIAPGKSATVVMKKAGRFTYYCRYHPNMTAEVIVGAPAK